MSNSEKDKILFWSEAGLVQFAIAKFMQKNFDADYYAIHDLNPNLKKDFLKQKIVNFKKEWYFWDHVSKTITKPDLDYLKQFEEKYGLNLWQLILTDRAFFKFNPYYKYKDREILSILEQECKFFENILDEIKPHFLIIKTTDFHRNHLLFELCRLKGVKILMLISARLGYRTAISSDYNKLDPIFSDKEISYDNSIQEIHDYVKEFQVFKRLSKKAFSSVRTPISFWKKLKIVFNWMTKTYDEDYKKIYLHNGINQISAIRVGLSLLIKNQLRQRFIDKNLVKKIPKNEKFLYFPLHVQPERSIDIDAPFYNNQQEVIFSIAKSLPIGFKLYVKEHYFMTRRNWRETSFYKEIMELPNVVLLHPSVNPGDLLKNCSLVITITGTAGLESAFYGKPSIIFADTIYSKLPSVYHLKNIEELPMVIRTSLTKKIEEKDINDYVNFIFKNSFEIEGHSEHIAQLRRKFHNMGFLLADHIPMNELDDFFEKNSSYFEKLAFEHIKKINDLKSNP